ncbi:MAG: hypothetical protein WC554_15025 [Clostridia bacterium]
MKQILCFYQVFKSVFSEKQEGCGDCSICVPNSENKKCLKYLPITIWSFEAIGGKNEEQEMVRISQT